MRKQILLSSLIIVLLVCSLFPLFHVDALLIPESYVYCNNYVAGSWTNPTYAYNNNTANGATIAWSTTGYCAYLTLNLSSTARGSKIRYWVGRSNTVITIMQIWIANQTGSWTQVYSATPTYGAYANATITFSQYTAMRFRFSKTGTASRTATVYETQAVNNSYIVADYFVDLSQWDTMFRIPYFSFAYGTVQVGTDVDGNVELNLTMPNNPASTTFAINFQYANLSFYYQPPLDVELNVSQYDFVNATHAIKGGQVITYRPENIVGSYAVYSLHEGNEYAAGKVFHIYRPLVLDNNGVKTWATMNINLLNTTNGILALAVSSSWMNTAVYPVVIDPIFGYSTHGSSYRDDLYGGNTYVGKFALADNDITITSLTAYCGGAYGSHTPSPSAGIYNDAGSGGLPKDVLGETAHKAIAAAAAENTFTFAAGPTLDADDYWLGLSSPDDGKDIRWYYDSGGVGRDAGWGHWPDDWDDGSGNTNKYTIWFDYETGGPTAYAVDLTKTFTIAFSKAIRTNYHLVMTQTITSAFVLQAIANYKVLLTQGITNGFVFNALTGYHVILNEATNLGLLFTSLSNYHLILTQGTTLGLDSLSALVYYVTLSLTANLGLLQYFQTAYNVILTAGINPTLTTLLHTAFNLVLSSTWTTGLISYAVNASAIINHFIVDLALNIVSTLLNPIEIATSIGSAFALAGLALIIALCGFGAIFLIRRRRNQD